MTAWASNMGNQFEGGSIGPTAGRDNPLPENCILPNPRNNIFTRYTHMHEKPRGFVSIFIVIRPISSQFSDCVLVTSHLVTSHLVSVYSRQELVTSFHTLLT